MAIPDRFQPLEHSPFGELVGPLYLQESDSLPILGVRVQPQHVNRRGLTHGGLLMTLADVAVSRAALAHLPRGAQIATASLNIAFLEAVEPGSWLEAVPSIDRLGRSLIHASCLIRVDERLAARVQATISVRVPGLE